MIKTVERVVIQRGRHKARFSITSSLPLPSFGVQLWPMAHCSPLLIRVPERTISAFFIAVSRLLYLGQHSEAVSVACSFLLRHVQVEAVGTRSLSHFVLMFWLPQSRTELADLLVTHPMLEPFAGAFLPQVLTSKCK